MPGVNADSVVSKVVLLLRAVVAAEPIGETTAALARAAGLNRSTVHRLLHELQGTGLVDRDRETAHWVSGPEMYLMGTAAGRRYDVTAISQPFVRRLALATGESAFYSVRRGMETVCLVREDGSFPLRSHVLDEGVRFPLGVASAGLVILAYLHEDEIRDYLSGRHLEREFGYEHSEHNIDARLRATRRDGYTLNPGLVVEGSWGMAAAVFNTDGAPIGALSLTGVEHRFAATRQPELGEMLLKAAHGLSTALRSPQAAARRPS